MRTFSYHRDGISSRYCAWARRHAFWIILLPSCASFLVVTPSKTTALASIPTPLDTLTSGLASMCRLPKGVQVDDSSAATEPIRLVRLYDVENSPSCRRVRERISELDLTIDRVVPAASNSRVFTDETLSPGTVLPRLDVILDDKESVLSGADAILAFFDQYTSTTLAGEDKDQLQGKLLAAGNVVASWLRTGRGDTVCSAALPSQPKQPLILYSYEGNQFCRLVREVLTELDLAYELRNAGKGSPRRQELAARTGGSSQCPYLVDPNTDSELAESADIIRYLYTNYAQWIPPNELLQWASATVVAAIKPVFTSTTPLLAGGSNDNNDDDFKRKLQDTEAEILAIVQSTPVVMYTYDWSPFSSEAKALLDHLAIEYTDISLGKEWIPGLINDPMTRAALLSLTGQSSLPHVFIGGVSIGGLFSGTPGLVPALEEMSLLDKVEAAQAKVQSGKAAVG